MGERLPVTLELLIASLVLPPSRVERLSSKDLPTVSRRPLPVEELELFTTGSESLSLESSHTVEFTLDSSTHSPDSILTRRTRAMSNVPDPSSDVPRYLPSVPDMLLTHLIPSVVVFRCSPRSPSLSGSTREPLIASQRSRRMREPVLFSRELEPMLSVPSELPWFLFFTQRSLPPSEPINLSQLVVVMVEDVL